MALIVRNGPRNHTRFLLWHTDDDRIEPGHCIKGRVDTAGLSPDGRYIAYGATDSRSGKQYGAISQVPWATALLFVQTGHCVGATPSFYKDGNVYWGTVHELEWRVPREGCPFRIFQELRRDDLDPNRSIGDRYKASVLEDGHGRRVEVNEGRILVDGIELIDTNPMPFEPIVPPD